MKIDYCLPIISDNQEKVFELVRSHREDYTYFEIWLDYLDSFDPTEFFRQLFALAPEENFIFLFRRQKLDVVQMSFDFRKALMRLFSGRSSFLDLDFLTQKEEIEFVRAEGLRVPVIFSYHNYGSTPPEDRLNAIVDEMVELRATVVKVACMCNSPSDALTLLKLQLALNDRGIKHIVLGMGPHGKITRIFGTLWGNMTIFAPARDTQQSAPGQLDRQRLQRIFEEIVDAG